MREQRRPLRTPTVKQAERDRLARDVEAFLEAGGKIERADPQRPSRDLGPSNRWWIER